MVEWLTKLGVGNDIRSLFNITDSPAFDYGDGIEEFAQGVFKVPATRNVWRCGNETAATVIVSWSASEAMAMITCRRKDFLSLSDLLILSLGSRLSKGQTSWIGSNLKRRRFVLVFPNDLPGRAADISVATGIRNIYVRQKWESDAIRINCRNKEFAIPATDLSLAAFERAAGVRSCIRTLKPTNCNTFLEQLYEQR